MTFKALTLKTFVFKQHIQAAIPKILCSFDQLICFPIFSYFARQNRKKKEYWNTNLKYCENSLTSSIFINYLEITNYLSLTLMQIKWKIHRLLCSASVNLKKNICRIIETLRTSILIEKPTVMFSCQYQKHIQD